MNEHWLRAQAQRYNAKRQDGRQARRDRVAKAWVEHHALKPADRVKAIAKGEAVSTNTIRNDLRARELWH